MSNHKNWGQGSPQKSNTAAGADSRPNWGQGGPQRSDTSSDVKPNWGQGGPMKSDTGMDSGHKPQWGQGGPMKSDTGVDSGHQPQWGRGGPQRSDTQAFDTHINNTRQYEVPIYSVFILNNVMYKNLRLISEESGEAKIFEVEASGKHYALKMYRYGIRPNHAILDRIMKLRGSGLLVDIYDHGTWHDDQQNADFDYEVMQLCTGGSLATVQLSGKEDKLKEFALKMTAAIDFLHKNGIVHRDVKPANFMFVDKKRQNFVLTDWGFAKLLDKDGRAVSDDGRTKLYTAPELYINIPGKVTYVDVKADFFSLGMALLALWKGEGLLIADEQKLVRQKLDEELPYPTRKEMSEHTLSLIKALTRNNPDKRAGFDDVKRWAKGEIIFDDPDSANQVSDYKIVFSGEKSLIAHNHEELGQIMWSNRKLAKKYLYNDKIADWLDEVDRPEMALRMREITEMEYPSNQDAGLYAACLELCPDMPFEGVDGNKISTQEELARELYDHTDYYKEYIGNPENPVWAYCRAVELSDEIKPLLKKDTLRKPEYIRELAFKLDPSLPYPMIVSTKTWQRKEVHSLEEYVNTFYAASMDCFCYQAGPDFMQWLQNVNPVMYGRAKTLVDKYADDPEYANELVHFAIVPDLGFDGKPLAESKLSTPEKIAEFMTLQECQRAETGEYVSLCAFEEFEISELRAYLVSKEKYGKQISYVSYCMEMFSTDNQKKSGPYNEDIATLKILAGWHGGSISLTLHGQKFTCPADLDKADLSSFNEEEQNLLANWLTLFFQEDPNADYKAKSYTSRMLEYFDFIDKRLPECKYIEHCNRQSYSDVRGAVERNKKAWSKARLIQWLCVIFCFIPLLTVCGAMSYLSVTTGSEPIEMAMKSLGHWCAIILAVVGAICCVDGGIIGIALGGLAGYWITELLFRFLAPVMPWLVIVLLLGVVVYFGRKIFIKMGRKFSSPDMSQDEIISRHRAGLAFNSRSKLLPDKAADYPVSSIDFNTNEVKQQMPKLIKNALLMLVLSVAGVFLCGWVVSHYDKEATDAVKTVEGSYTGDVQGTPSTIKLYKNDDGLWQADMVIDYKSGTTEQIMVAEEKSEEPETLYLKDNPKVSLTFKAEEPEGDVKTLTGTYINSKGNKRTVNYKQVETIKK